MRSDQPDGSTLSGFSFKIDPKALFSVPEAYLAGSGIDSRVNNTVTMRLRSHELPFDLSSFLSPSLTCFGAEKLKD